MFATITINNLHKLLIVFEILLLFYIINFEKGQIPNLKNIRQCQIPN